MMRPIKTNGFVEAESRSPSGLWRDKEIIGFSRMTKDTLLVLLSPYQFTEIEINQAKEARDRQVEYHKEWAKKNGLSKRMAQQN